MPWEAFVAGFKFDRCEGACDGDRRVMRPHPLGDALLQGVRIRAGFNHIVDVVHNVRYRNNSLNGAFGVVEGLCFYLCLF